MKIVIVARKTLLEAWREPQLLLLTLLLPLVFLVIAKFSYTMPLQVTYPVLLLDPDDIGRPIREMLSQEQYENGTAVFSLATVADKATAEAALKAQTAAALLIVSNWCAVNDGRADTLLLVSDCLQFIIEGDALSTRFFNVSVLLDRALHQWGDVILGVEMPVGITAVHLAEFPPQTEFDLYAPGMMMFAWLMLIPQTAMLVARELRRQTLARLRLTKLRAWEFLGGVSLAQLIMAVLQVIILFWAARLMGFHHHGRLWLAGFVGIVVSISAIGMGLLVACFAENDSQAANAGSTVSMVQVFISGSFYALPPITLFTLYGHQMDLFDLVPATSGLLALQQVLTYGAGLSQIGFRLGWVGLLAAVYFAAGVYLFQHKGLMPHSHHIIHS